MKQSFNLSYVVINEFKTKGLIKNGLTIPFLIGIYQRQREKQGQSIDLDSSECIKILINDIANKQNVQKFWLYTCPNIKEYILKTLGDKDTDITQNSLYRHINNLLYFEEFFDILNPTIDNTSEYLYEKYRCQISNRKFSKINGKWCDYSNDEQQLINKILKI